MTHSIQMSIVQNISVGNQAHAFSQAEVSMIQRAASTIQSDAEQRNVREIITDGFWFIIHFIKVHILCCCFQSSEENDVCPFLANIVDVYEERTQEGERILQTFATWEPTHREGMTNYHWDQRQNPWVQAIRDVLPAFENALEAQRNSNFILSTTQIFYGLTEEALYRGLVNEPAYVEFRIFVRQNRGDFEFEEVMNKITDVCYGIGQLSS